MDNDGETVKPCFSMNSGGWLLRSLRRRFIDNKKRGWIPCHFQKIGQLGHGFQANKCGSTGVKHIGAASCSAASVAE